MRGTTSESVGNWRCLEVTVPHAALWTEAEKSERKTMDGIGTLECTFYSMAVPNVVHCPMLATSEICQNNTGATAAEPKTLLVLLVVVDVRVPEQRL